MEKYARLRMADCQANTQASRELVTMARLTRWKAGAVATNNVVLNLRAAGISGKKPQRKNTVMYKLLGGDGKEYGPASAEQVRQWIVEGRADAHTQALTEGSGEWKALAEFPEFAAALGKPAVAPTGAPSMPTAPSKTSSLAIWSLVLGVLGIGCFGLTAIAGLVLGLVAMSRIRKSNGALRGWGLGLAGTVVSGAVLFLGLTAAMAFPAVAGAKSRAQEIACMNNLRQLSLAMHMYAEDNNGRLPAATNWNDAIQKYTTASPGAYLCPAGPPGPRCHYAFNAALSGVELNSVKARAETVLLFETEWGGWNVSGSRELAGQPPRHRKGVGVAFADGHSEIAVQRRIQQLRWEP
jgi:prepilin-type processing-associated H-X9-DG protein